MMLDEDVRTKPNKINGRTDHVLDTLYERRRLWCQGSGDYARTIYVVDMVQYNARRSIDHDRMANDLRIKACNTANRFRDGRMFDNCPIAPGFFRNCFPVDFM